MRKRALITGIIGQEGLSLTNFLLDKDYEIHGLIQRNSQLGEDEIKKFEIYFDKRLFFHLGDLTDSSSINRIMEKVKPDEIYHLAGHNHVDSSFDMPEYTTEVNALGVLRILDAMKTVSFATKLFNMSTCQIFSGDIYPQNENTRVDPKSPYAIAKLYAHSMVKNYRECYNLFAVNGICYNQVSAYYSSTFIYKKIISAVKSICKGDFVILEVGNLNSIREWGNTEDYARAMWLILQEKDPTDFVIGTGEAKTIREWIILAYELIGIKLEFVGEGLEERATGQDGRIYVKVNPKLFRPADAKRLVSDSKLIRTVTKWKPEYDSKKFIKVMLEE